ncbi:MFS general substrate transporter [Macrolepiota fuliginosa MF-IS2]|uniref:MFS general substrate transporter n=1 Tax=Macrolepiota fuliginosa MF-IS2 TaxID=1400762 RepID=A0A9P5X3I6_9AGAR|nr:MFS general substrate transporter [Macrolepiota fuliginosa MF-IS2]
MTVSEETPLLHNDHSHISEGTSKRELIYERFSPRQKRVLVAIVSWCGLMPLFVSATIYPSIPAMVKDFNTTPQIIGLAVSISILAMSMGALAAASYSTFYGRRPIYLFALPLLVFGSVGVSLSRTVGELYVFRFLQAAGASPGFSIGAGVIGDIYKLEERGSAMGVFLAAILLGPSLAPVAGGLAAEYASWRHMQFIIGVFGLIAFGIIWTCFPETSHPGVRGIDKLCRQAENGVKIRWNRYIVNPLSPLGLLRAPNILAVTIACFTVALTFFVLMVPIAYTIGTKYNIRNDALIGACAIPGGLGEIIGAPLSGRLSDRIVVKWRRSRGGVWYPEDRLRAATSGLLYFLPLSMLLSGLIINYVGGPLGLALVFVCLFANGFGLELVLSPAAAYVVDVLHSRSAEAVAANNGFRSVILSVAIAGIMPMIDAYGVVATNTASAVLTWFGFGLLWLTIRYGESMRAWCNIGFSTAETN